jgi:hypothetical protein
MGLAQTQGDAAAVRTNSNHSPVSKCIDTNAEYRNEISEDEIESNEDVIKQNQLMLRRESVQSKMDLTISRLVCWLREARRRRQF